MDFSKISILEFSKEEKKLKFFSKKILYLKRKKENVRGRMRDKYILLEEKVMCIHWIMWERSKGNIENYIHYVD